MKGVFIYSSILLGMITYFYTMRLIYRLFHGESNKMSTKIISDILGGSILVGLFMYFLLGFLI